MTQTGNDRPTHGEIDVMEAVNQANTSNQMTLHITDGCSMSVKHKETGNVLTENCYNGTNSNPGCGILGDNSRFVPSFNAAGGGIMAMDFGQQASECGSSDALVSPPISQIRCRIPALDPKLSQTFQARVLILGAILRICL